MASTAGVPAALGARRDASCEAARADHPPTGCADFTHVLRHHVTTPFFVRMSLFDRLVASHYDALDLADPDTGQPVTSEVFGSILASELHALGRLDVTAEEQARISQTPGVFAPACTDHDGLHDDAQIYGVGIGPRQNPSTFFQIFENWRRRSGPAILTGTLGNSTCRDPPSRAPAPRRPAAPKARPGVK
jgi:hypothetical protein